MQLLQNVGMFWLVSDYCFRLNQIMEIGKWVHDSIIWVYIIVSYFISSSF